MKVRAIVALFTLFCWMFLVWPLPAQATTPRVCVDAGHGGTAPGAVYKSLEEKNVNLDIATRLQTLLQNAGYTVVMTRTRDTTLDNSQRAAICNNAHAEVLTSIHLNASSDHSIDYTLGLYGNINKDQVFAKTVNRTMSGLGIPNNGISHFAAGQLLKAVMPATLAETVFISSDYEYGLLTDGTGNRQQQIAQLLLQGIKTWFGVAFPTATATPLPPSTEEPAPTATARPTPTETLVPGPEPGPCDTPPGVTPVSPAEIDGGNMWKPQVAFTFDAGGEVAPAPQILGILNKRAVHATWFFTGIWAEQNPHIVRHVADAGYEIGNHTVTHPDLTTLTDTQVCNELTQAEKIISGIAGRTTRPYFRPPFGARNQQVRHLAANLGYRTVYWTIDTLDWQPQSTPDSILQRIQSQLTNGAIILMHAGSSSEAQALDRVITMVQQKGYQLVTLPEIVQGTG